MAERPSTSRSRLGSVGLDAGAACVCVLAFWLPLDGRPGPYMSGGLIVLFFGGMLLRSLLPLVAVGVVTVVTITGLALGLAADPFVAVAWTLYPVAVTWGTPRSLSIVKAAAGLVVIAIALFGTADGASGVLRFIMLSLLALAGSWLLGGTTRRAVLEAEHATRAESQAAVAAERLRVVRELHDVVSHSLGTIAVTAGVAARVGADDPGRLRDRLERIEVVSRQALDELRTTLTFVRVGEEGAERRPQPGVGDLLDLAERARGGGVRVSMTVTGVDTVSPSIGLAVYRVVQEGLTNAVRHASGAHCAVTVCGRGGDVLVTVADDGAGPRTPHGEPGYGLVGLRERVELLGGGFAAGPRPGGGFEVRATIPLPEAVAHE
ncbi:sensor histidine kinase [Actinomadura sp. ATCC 31491]|uniref:histidine kinase n=1 Tax=Actinomadura luzonensis TaxID=2805427 RepID=A0ABT0FLU7_9ACTN|nr:sensor histidine kinase [Actinomadura luzonensis]MCK2213297.1 sensor histidine kinase [Actinomadura luzonensis]